MYGRWNTMYHVMKVQFYSFSIMTFIINTRKFYCSIVQPGMSITISGASTPKSGKKGMLSMVDNMLKLHTGTKPTNRKHAKRNQVWT